MLRELLLVGLEFVSDMKHVLPRWRKTADVRRRGALVHGFALRSQPVLRLFSPRSRRAVPCTCAIRGLTGNYDGAGTKLRSVEKVLMSMKTRQQLPTKN